MSDWLYHIKNVDTEPFLFAMKKHKKSWQLEKDLILTKSTRGEKSSQIEYTDAIDLSKIFKNNLIKFDKCLIVIDKNTPKKVIINEYLLASEFFLEKIQIGYLNAILDKLSKKLRKLE